MSYAERSTCQITSGEWLNIRVGHVDSAEAQSPRSENVKLAYDRDSNYFESLIIVKRRSEKRNFLELDQSAQMRTALGFDQHRGTPPGHIFIKRIV